LDDGVAFPSCGLAFRIGPDLVREVEKVSSSIPAEIIVHSASTSLLVISSVLFGSGLLALIVFVRGEARIIDRRATP
jgi:hypothetical protein